MAVIRKYTIGSNTRELFAARDGETGDRMEMTDISILEEEGRFDDRHLGYKGIIQTQHGTKYAVYGAPCDLPGCNCAAYVVELKS